MSIISSVTKMMTVVTRISQMMTITQAIVTITIGTGSIAKPVIVQPGVSLGVSLSISLSSGLGLSLLYGLDNLLLGSSGSGDSRDQAVGEDTVSTGDSGTLIVLAANRGSVDQGMVNGVGVAVG